MKSNKNWSSASALLVVAVYHLCFLESTYAIRWKGDYYYDDVKNGDNVTLDCEAQANDQSNATWKRGATGLLDWLMSKSLDSNPEKYSLLLNHSLIIKNVTDEDRGVYLCKRASGTIQSFLAKSSLLAELGTYIFTSGNAMIFCITLILLFLAIPLGCKIVYLKVTFETPFKYNTCKIATSNDHAQDSDWRMSIEEPPPQISTRCLKSKCFLGLKKLMKTVADFTTYCFIVLDIGSDVALSLVYYINDEPTWSGLTILFVFLPFLVSLGKKACIHLWSLLTSNDTAGQDCNLLDCVYHLPFLQLIKVGHFKKEMNAILNSKNDSLMTRTRKVKRLELKFLKFRLLECVCENVPQLMLQSHIWYYFIPRDSLASEQLLITVTSSFFGITKLFSDLFLCTPFCEDGRERSVIKTFKLTFMVYLLTNSSLRIPGGLYLSKLSLQIKHGQLGIGCLIPVLVIPVLLFVIMKWVKCSFTNTVRNFCLALVCPCFKLKDSMSTKKMILIYFIIGAYGNYEVYEYLKEVQDYPEASRAFVYMPFLAISYLCWFALCDDELTQLIGLNLCCCLKGPLNSHPNGVYRSAIRNQWKFVLKHLIQTDLNDIEKLTPTAAYDYLRQGGHLNFNIRKGKGAFHIACEEGKIELVKVFLRAPEFLGHSKTVDSRLQTPLHIVCEKGHEEIATLFFEAENHQHLHTINTMDKKGKTPFIYACLHGYKNIVKLFLDLPDDQFKHLNATNKQGQTPFMIACIIGDEEIVSLFINSWQWNKIDLGSKAPYEKVIWHFLADKGSLNIMNLIADKMGSNKQLPFIDSKDQDGRTAYLKSCISGKESVFSWFVSHAETFGIDLDGQDNYGMTDLHLACKSNAQEIIKTLLQTKSRRDIEKVLGPALTADNQNWMEFKLTYMDSKKSQTLTLMVDTLEFPTKVQIKKTKCA